MNKSRIFKKIGIWLIFYFVWFPIFSQQYSISNPKQITSSELHFQCPKWSPDGNKILITVDKKTSLYLINLDKSNEITLISNENAAGLNYNWRKDNSFTYVIKEDNKLKQKNNSSYTNRIKSSINIIDTIVYIDKLNLKIKAKLSDDSDEWIVTKCDGAYYNPILSPNKKNVVVNEGANVMLFPIEGSNEGFIIGRGIANSWSYDNKSVLIFLDESKDGHSITNSELSIYNIVDKKTSKLTNTLNSIEMWPYFSPDGKKIVYVEGKTGQVFICDLNYKK